MNYPSFSTILPPAFMEASNGILFAVLSVVMCGFCYAYVVKLSEAGHYSKFYRASKPLIAMGIMVGGFWFRTGLIWWLRHAENHGIAPPFWHDAAAGLVGMATIASMLGGFCWFRVTMPVDCGPQAWVVLAFAAIMFGVLFAM